MLFRRREAAWEVVDSRNVDPVPMYYEDEDLDLDVVKDSNVRRTYVVEIKRDAMKNNVLPRTVVFAREQLLQEVNKNGYNILLLEGWRVTVLRKAKLYRVEVEYSGRPARTQNKVPQRHPPFMAVLETCD